MTKEVKKPSKGIKTCKSYVYDIMTYKNLTPLELSIKIKHLEDSIKSLEYGDDSLFTGGSGNLEVYNQLKKELNELKGLYNAYWDT